MRSSEVLMPAATLTAKGQIVKLASESNRFYGTRYVWYPNREAPAEVAGAWVGQVGSTQAAYGIFGMTGIARGVAVGH